MSELRQVSSSPSQPTKIPTSNLSTAPSLRPSVFLLLSWSSFAMIFCLGRFFFRLGSLSGSFVWVFCLGLLSLFLVWVFCLGLLSGAFVLVFCLGLGLCFGLSFKQELLCPAPSLQPYQISRKKPITRPFKRYPPSPREPIFQNDKIKDQQYKDKRPRRNTPRQQKRRAEGKNKWHDPPPLMGSSFCNNNKQMMKTKYEDKRPRQKNKNKTKDQDKRPRQKTKIKDRGKIPRQKATTKYPHKRTRRRGRGLGVLVMREREANQMDMCSLALSPLPPPPYATY